MGRRRALRQAMTKDEIASLISMLNCAYAAVSVVRRRRLTAAKAVAGEAHRPGAQ